MKRQFLKPAIWPNIPAALNHDEIALILLNLPAGIFRIEARQRARSVLREYLAALRPASSFVESSKGPLIMNADIKVSLSYAGDKALIGFASGRALGVDIVKVEKLDEIEVLAKHYLPVTPLNETDFALAWAGMEACCKVLSLPLAEINKARRLSYASCELIECEQIDGYRIAVATLPGN